MSDYKLDLLSTAAHLGAEAAKQAGMVMADIKSRRDAANAQNEMADSLESDVTGFNGPKFVNVAKVGAEWHKLLGNTAPDSADEDMFNLGTKAAESFIASNTGKAKANGNSTGRNSTYAVLIRLGNGAETLRRALADAHADFEARIASAKAEYEAKRDDANKAALESALQFRLNTSGSTPAVRDGVTVNDKDGKRAKFFGTQDRTFEHGGKDVIVPGNGMTNMESLLGKAAKLARDYGVDFATRRDVLAHLFDNGGRIPKADKPQASPQAAIQVILDNIEALSNMVNLGQHEMMVVAATDMFKAILADKAVMETPKAPPLPPTPQAVPGIPSVPMSKAEITKAEAEEIKAEAEEIKAEAEVLTTGPAEETTNVVPFELGWNPAEETKAEEAPTKPAKKKRGGSL